MNINIKNYPHQELKQWYNSPRYEVSYKPIFKSGSTTFKHLLGCEEVTIFDEEHHRPHYERQFTVVRDQVERTLSIYREMQAMNHTRGADTFEEWVRYIYEHGLYDKHQLPQMFGCSRWIWIRVSLSFFN